MDCGRPASLKLWSSLPEKILPRAEAGNCCVKVFSP
jgi:hypothetical protein